MSFPKDIFGKCPVCGGAGKDNPNPGSAFVASDTPFEGMPLHWYLGRLMCQLCKKELMARLESRTATEKRTFEQRFRDRLGFRRTMAS